MVRKDWASQNSIALSWQAPAFSNGAVLDYEIKYYEKVGPIWSFLKNYIYLYRERYHAGYIILFYFKICNSLA
jgi:hypothetical protein